MWSCQKCVIKFITVKSPINRLVIIKKEWELTTDDFSISSLLKRGTRTRKDVYGSRGEWPWRTFLFRKCTDILQYHTKFWKFLFVNLHHSKHYSRASIQCLNWADSTSDLTPAKYNVNVSNFPKFSRKKTEQNLSTNNILNILKI